jgi:type II secretory pathway predicted ATPase ExeA
MTNEEKAKMARPKLNEETPYQMAFKPIILKGLSVDCGISQTQIGKVTGLSRTSINLLFNRGYIPKECPDFKQKVEAYISADVKAMQWLIERQLKVQDIWQPLGKDLRHVSPAADNQNMWQTRRQAAIVPGDPELITSVEVEMISPEAQKHFKIFRSPFIDDIQKESDVFMSEEHRYIEAAMLDAAKHSGFLAIIAEVGSGKTVIRRKVMEQLKKDGDMIVIFPQIIDKTRINFSSICDAIIMDLSEESPKRTLEAKSRQVHKLLQERAKQGFRSVLIVEEAHDLTPSTLKYLKRFQEIEDGYRKLLGIILLGQTELNNLLDESRHIEMREVIRRIQKAEIRGLNGNTKEYLKLKFKRLNVKIEDIFDDSAFPALAKRLTTKDRRDKSISHAYPLVINNFAARAMNMAYEMGEKKVTADVIMAI